MKTHPLLLSSLLAAWPLAAQTPKTSVSTSGGTARAEANGDGSTPTAGGIENTLPSLPGIKAEADSTTKPGAGSANAGGTSSSTSKQHSSSVSESSQSTSVNGRTVTVKRHRDKDGKEKVTVTTTERGGKPKVEELTPEEYEKKYGDKKNDAPKKGPTAPQIGRAHV